jgi:hypothetical protein
MATQMIPYTQQNISLQYVLTCAKEGKVHLFESMASDWPFESCQPTSYSWYAIVPTVLYLCPSLKMREWLKKNIHLFQLPHQQNQNGYSPLEIINAILKSIGKFEERDLRSCIITLNEFPQLSDYVFDTDYYFCEEFSFWSDLKQPLFLSSQSQKKILSDLITDTPTDPPSEIDRIMKSFNVVSMKLFYKKYLKTTLSIGIKPKKSIKYFKSIVCLRFFTSECVSGFNWFISKFPQDTTLPMISVDNVKISLKDDPPLSSPFFPYWKKHLTKMIPVECILKKLFWHCPLDTFQYLVPLHINDDVKRCI